MAPVRKKNVTNGIIVEIQRMLAEGELREGDKLPNQNDFAAQLGVSRASLREALHTLALLGVIEQKPGAGTVIRAQISAFLMDNLDSPMISGSQGALELIEARQVLETSMIELAIDRAGDAEISHLGEIIQKLSRFASENQVEEYRAVDIQFHYEIARAAHNRFLLHLFVTIRHFLEQFFVESFNLVPDILEKSQKHHEEIFQALKAGDKKKARAEIAKHMKLGRTTVNKYFRRGDKTEGMGKAHALNR
jgi:GntR family transcriptional repressor for pyruvate dehydrogenase complex